MICDKCGYNLTTHLKCPNCGRDHSTPENAAIETGNSSPETFAEISDPDFTPKNRRTKQPKIVSLHAVSPELYNYAMASLFYDLTWLVVFGVTSFAIIFGPPILGWVTLPLLAFFAVDFICNLLIRAGKEWILAFYIPFSFLFFPLIVLSDLAFIILRRWNLRSVRLISNRFFLADFRKYRASKEV